MVSMRRMVVLVIASTKLCDMIGLGGVTVAAAVERPNILFIYTDDQSHRSVSCYPKDARNYYGPQLVNFNGPPSVSVTGYSTDNYTDWAVDFITNETNQQFLQQGRPTEKPWYLWLCYGAVHGPSTPADRHFNDLIPTFFSYANVTPPWKMHGHDLRPLLEDPASDWPHPVMISQTNRLYGSATAPLPVGEEVYHKDCPWYSTYR